MYKKGSQQIAKYLWKYIKNGKPAGNALSITRDYWKGQTGGRTSNSLPSLEDVEELSIYLTSLRRAPENLSQLAVTKDKVLELIDKLQYN